MSGHVARADVDIEASPDQVWSALTDPTAVAAYMFGATVDTDWEPGSPITWSGEYDGRPYQDKGEVVTAEPGRRLVVTHYSPLSGAPDVPESYHTVSYDLSPADGGTHLVLEQDNSASAEEAEQFSENWAQMLGALKKYVESA